MAGLRTWLPDRRGRVADGLIPFADALAALGREAVMGEHHRDVAADQIVGTFVRHRDFDADFGLLNRALRGRWEQVRAAMNAGVYLPPVQLVQLGELYFVVDGHHRVSVARAMGLSTVTARVRHICTTAFAMCCLRLAHLPSKSAERAFLERIPLADDLRTDLWLDSPASWPRLADAAESWAFGETLGGRALADRRELASTWWADEVTPLVQGLRAAGTGAGMRDVELYASALTVRDGLGLGHWPDDLAERVQR